MELILLRDILLSLSVTETGPFDRSRETNISRGS